MKINKILLLPYCCSNDVALALRNDLTRQTLKVTVAAYGKVKIQIEFVSGVSNEAFVTGAESKAVRLRRVSTASLAVLHGSSSTSGAPNVNFRKILFGRRFEI